MFRFITLAFIFAAPLTALAITQPAPGKVENSRQNNTIKISSAALRLQPVVFFTSSQLFLGNANAALPIGLKEEFHSLKEFIPQLSSNSP